MLHAYVHTYILCANERTWVVCTEADSDPAAGGDADRVALDGVDEVEPGRVASRVVVPGPMADDE
jgi:hypothetical protein